MADCREVDHNDANAPDIAVLDADRCAMIASVTSIDGYTDPVLTEVCGLDGEDGNDMADDVGTVGQRGEGRMSCDVFHH